ncbi:hypothetical protein TNIN_302891 [Trichonephila inaurata madagascariensis]|uniref:Uncharacterized protein n=1 Tax=Trichonephila inaurata madagascariensis TaxID=2747483 RepID=A0A8X6Y9H0_9ARAC|nr:hypothetical protein TNIN_302891 [Trichonephila inaurata madagascariensis]
MDEASRFPLASKVAFKTQYMDDVKSSGAQNLTLLTNYNASCKICWKHVEMKLHKWKSNSRSFLIHHRSRTLIFNQRESAIKPVLVETNRRLFHVQSLNPFNNDIFIQKIQMF